MVSDIFGSFIRRVAILTIAYLTVMINHLKERNNRSPKVLWFEVMIVLSPHSYEALEKVAVGQRPLATALTAENPKQLPGVITQANLPCDVAVTVNGMVWVIAFTRPHGVGRIDKVTPG
jgi:hypothetical protein